MYFPAPYPGELLGSTVGRAVRHLGLPLRTLVQRVLLRPDANLSFFLPAAIPRLAQLTHLPAHQLVFDHTPFPFWSAYLHPCDVQALLALWLRPGLKEPASRRRLLQMGWQRCTRLRFCPQCRAEELQRYGETYWHRDHFLPTLVDCPLHGCPLLADPHSWSKHRAFRLLPQDVQTAVPVPRPDGVSVPQALARVSRQVLLRATGDIGDWREDYRAQAQRLGYLYPSGAVSAVQLVRELQALYGPPFLDALGCPVEADEMRAWPVLLLRRSATTRFSAVKHLLLEGFFALSRGPGPSARRKTGCPPRPAQELDAQAAAAIQERWQQAIRAGERLTVRAMLLSLGIHSAVRNRRRELVRTSALLQAFRRSAQWRSGGGYHRAATPPPQP